MKQIKPLILIILISLAIGCAAMSESDSPAPSSGADTNNGLRAYASPEELHAIRQSIDSESPSTVNLHQRRGLMRQKGFVWDGRGWRRVGTRKSNTP
jgi:hypothetical protein